MAGMRSRAPFLMGIAPKRKGGHKKLTKGVEEVGEVSAE
jgi:hypothetical protein